MVIRKPKYKLGRRLGAFIHRKCQTQKFAANEAKKRKTIGIKKPTSDYGHQLLEKQKVRFYYGITEKQLRRYVKEAMKSDDTNKALYQKLELRLDSVVHHSGLAGTQPMARQMVSHGHITVNGRKVTIPSYIVKKGDIVEVRPQSRDRKIFTERAEEIAQANPPAWMKVDPKNLKVEIVSDPDYDPTALPFDFKAVFEFYTK